MTEVREPIRFCFDFLSPYAYVAWRALPAIAARHERVIEPVPVLLGALLNHHGQRGPAEIPAKRAYTIKDVYRKASALGVLPFTTPKAHPFNPLLALRVASIALAPAERRRAIDALFLGVWGGGDGVEGAPLVIKALEDAGLPGAPLVARAGTQPVKERLHAATDRAIAEGVFGVPTCLVDGELFFGVDGLEHLDRFLAGHDPVPPELVEAWERTPATASRA